MGGYASSSIEKLFREESSLRGVDISEKWIMVTGTSEQECPGGNVGGGVSAS